MAHPLDRPIATDLSYEAFQLRRLRGELSLQSLDSTHRRLHPIVRGASFREFIADPDMGNVPGATVSDDCEQVRLSKRRRG